MTGDDELDREDEELVASFHEHLTAEKGLSEKTASKHVDAIELFATYLEGYEQGTLPEVTGIDIEEYLGDWYIRKVASSRSDLRQVPASFKKFYKFLHERGYLGDEELEDILGACKNPDRYIRRLDTYFELDPDSDTWEQDYERWFFGGLDSGAMGEVMDENQPVDVNLGIGQVVSEGDIESSKTSPLNDFHTFLQYLVSNNGMKLTTVNSFIPRKDLFALNKLMESPEDLKSTANQPDSRTLHLFYNIAKTLNLLVVNEKNRLEVTPQINIFMNLSPKEQFTTLFDAFWNRTEWDRLLQPLNIVGHESVQQSRDAIIAHLATCEPGRRYNFGEAAWKLSVKIGGIDETPEVDSLMNFLTMIIFAERIMPELKLFGLLDCEYKKERDEYAARHDLGLEWFSITTLGETIFRGLANDSGDF